MITEEHIDSIANGELPTLTAIIQCRGDSHHHLGTIATKTPRLPDNVNPIFVCSLWIDLFVQLSHTAQECAQPGTVQGLKAFGIRRPTQVTLSLAREYAKAHEMATEAGFSTSPHHVSCLMRERLLSNDLDRDFQVLAEAYRLLLLAMQPRSGSSLSRWLEGRAQVHFAQAKAIRQGAWP